LCRHITQDFREPQSAVFHWLSHSWVTSFINNSWAETSVFTSHMEAFW
jgi:hypothetical protein